MTSQVSAEDQFKLWVLLYQVRHAIYVAVRRELRQYGISPMEAAVLSILKAVGKNVTPAEISRWLFRKPHSVSGLVTRMEKKGLIRKANDLSRKNLVRVTMTEKGEQAYSRSTKIDSVARIISSLTGEQHQQIRRCLEILRASALEEIGEKEELLFP